MHGKENQDKKSLKDKCKEKTVTAAEADSDSSSSDAEQEELAIISYPQENRTINQVSVFSGMNVGCSGSVKVGDITTQFKPSISQMRSRNTTIIDQFNGQQGYFQPFTVSVNTSCSTKSDEVASLIAQLKDVYPSSFKMRCFRRFDFFAWLAVIASTIASF